MEELKSVVINIEMNKDMDDIYTGCLKKNWDQ